MLLYQYCSRCQQSSLLAIHNAFEDGPKTDLRLAEADITAEQTLHNPRLFHVRFNLSYHPLLVFRFFIGKSGLKILLPDRIRRKSMALDLSPGGIERYQISCQLSNRLASFCLLALPLRATQLRQPGLLLIRTDVFAYLIQCLNRNIQITIGIEQMQIISLTAGGPDLLQILIASDTVILMYHQLTRLQIREEIDRLTATVLASTHRLINPKQILRAQNRYFTLRPVKTLT